MGIMERLDAVVENALSQNRIVGGVILVSRQGELIYSRAAGMADRHYLKLSELDSIFRFSSLTKPIVAATILAMVEAGLLGIDDAVTKHLPYFTPQLSDGSRPKITVRHLLTHTAGLTKNIDVSPSEVLEPRFKEVGGNYWHLSLEENMARLANRPLLFAPGEGWSYSQSLDVLGAIAAKLVSGTLADAIARYVTGPLGMVDTGFEVRDLERLATPYADNKPMPVTMDEPHPLVNAFGDVSVFSPGRILDERVYNSGGSGMAGTASDFLLFLNSLLGFGTPILSAEYAHMGGQNQIGDIPRDPVDAGQRFGFFGAVLDDPVAAATPQNKGTFAWGGVFGNSWFADPTEGLAVVALTNTAHEGCTGAFPREIRDAVYG